MRPINRLPSTAIIGQSLSVSQVIKHLMSVFGEPWYQVAPVGVGMVLDSRHAKTLRLHKSMIATSYRKPFASEMQVMSPR
jgi:hypothetical protein